MANFNVQEILVSTLHFDATNPRLIEFENPENVTEEKLVEILCRAMNVEEIILSLYHSGYFKNDPLIAIPNGSEYTVIEGNRRLAAIKVITEYPKYGKYYPKSLPEPDQNLINKLQFIPTVVETSKKNAWDYIGFKHVNGASKWGSYAKAEYIAQVHKDFGVTLNEIGLTIGDTNKTVQRLYQSLMVIEQAEAKKVFDKSDINAPRLYFSHLYTGLQYEGIRKYIGLKDAEAEASEPVEKIEELGTLLGFMYGSKKNNTRSVITSQNPDLRYLDAVIQSSGAISALKATGDLYVAYEISQPDDYKFVESLNEAKRALYKSLQYAVTGYFGELSHLRTSGSIAKMADELYELMEKKQKAAAGEDQKKTRLTE